MKNHCFSNFSGNSLSGAEKGVLAAGFGETFSTLGRPAPAIEKAELVDHFEGEYGFINKRLPVVKVAYRTPEKTTLYVEPATGRLAARVENLDRYEGLSFAFLHKYHAVGSLGKNVRDAITMALVKSLVQMLHKQQRGFRCGSFLRNT